MSTAPKVSVVVVTFNHGDFLRKCLDSIVSQQVGFDFEVIIGDDASTDGITPAIVREFHSRFPNIIVPIIRPKNIGMSENFLDLTRRARGKYVAVVDGDDLAHPGKLQTQADFLDRNPSHSFVVHKVGIINAHGERIGFLPEKDPPATTDINYLVEHNCYFSHSSKMYRRNAMISQQRERVTVDLFYHVEHASRGLIGFLPEVLGDYRRHGSGNYMTARKSPRALEVLHHAIRDGYLRALDFGANAKSVRRRVGETDLLFAFARLDLGDCEGFRKWQGSVRVFSPLKIIAFTVALLPNPLLRLVLPTLHKINPRYAIAQ